MLVWLTSEPGREIGESNMEVSACPECGTDDIRYERTEVTAFPLVSWRSGDDRPIFVASEESRGTDITRRIVCANGHTDPDRVGFDLEWA
jgi:hypothetical protein